ncbi:MAG TPA: tetratricopeptide repeat protein [Pseudonocardiaceae bacterium]
MPNRIPPCQPDHFTNHDRLRQDLLDFARSTGAEPKIAVLTGPSGVGKTALALLTAQALPEPDIRLYTELDAEAPGAVAEALAELLTELGMAPVPDRMSARVRAFRARTEGRSVLLVIDGASTAAQVRALLPAEGLVLVTEARPLSVEARSFPLPPLDADAARTLLARYAGAEPDLVEQVVELAEGVPLLLRIAGALLARRPAFAADILTTAYQSLSEPAQRCYRALALPGTTAEISVDALPDAHAAPALVAARLVDEPAEGRFRTSELVRRHARAVAPPDADAVTRLREHYFARTAATYRGRWPQAEPWFTAPAGTESVDPDWLDVERDNIRAALEHAFVSGERELVATWCVLLWPYYEHGKHTADLLATHELGVHTENRALRSLLRTRIGFGHLFNGDLDQAIAACEQALELATDQRLTATALEGLGLALLAADQDDRARPVLRRNLDLARDLAEPRRLALACLHDAKVEPPKVALALLAEAAPIFATDPVNLAKTNLWRGRKLAEQGDVKSAREALDTALAELTALRRPFDRAEVLVALGDLHTESAADHYAQARAVFEEWGFSQRAAQLPR